MSDVELEQAAMAPHRWIQRCTTFARQHSNNLDAELQPITTRIIRNPLVVPGVSSKRLLVLLAPGGRYLISYSLNACGTWVILRMSIASYLLLLDPKRELTLAWSMRPQIAWA